ncbi:MAG: YlxR family protein, partial [Propionibacteriaceae bacterium]
MSDPVRTCIGCRQSAHPSSLLRLAVADGTLLVDQRRRLPGRGAYLHDTPDCWAAATRKRAFGRALRLTGPALADARAQVERLAQEPRMGIQLSGTSGAAAALDRFERERDRPEPGSS